MQRSSLVAILCLSVVASACKTQALSQGGTTVHTSQSAPVDSGWDPHSCKSLGYLVGRGGGSFGGGWISNEKLIEYAMNDLRNQAAEKGANFVQHDSPTLGQSGSDGNSTTSTATVSGTAYLCEMQTAGGEAPVTPAPAAASTKASANPAPRCVPGATQACVGAGGCSGGQACLKDGSGFGPCDCGPAPAAAAAPAPAAVPETAADSPEGAAPTAAPIAPEGAPPATTAAP